jgi:hypothetical protein
MKNNIGPIDRISLRDARYTYGRHVLDLVKVEPVCILCDGKEHWLCWFNGLYIFEPYERLSILRDDGTCRPLVTKGGELLNCEPLKLAA